MTSPAAALARIELKVVGVAVKDFVKLDGGAAQPGYVDAAIAGVSHPTQNARIEIMNSGVNLIACGRTSNLVSRAMRFDLSEDEMLILGLVRLQKEVSL